MGPRKMRAEMPMADMMMDCPKCWGKNAKCARCGGAKRVADEQLSPHFKLSELLESPTARAQGIDNDPSPEILANLRKLCVELLEPVRALIGPMHINSGYRSDALNAAVPGSSKTSAHSYGRAADIRPLKVNRKQMCDAIIASKLKYDQVICEPTWVHLGHSYPKDGAQRMQKLSMFRVNGASKYEPYNTNDPRIAG
jgi:hypothetical protein